MDGWIDGNQNKSTEKESIKIRAVSMATGLDRHYRCVSPACTACHSVISAKVVVLWRE